ncbi:uncharacterized protein yc1106_03800 [Curvularia clavata]|uniref:Uncharacterized protein n=1 Tax=Curvularia clavata TaxID=95742 RepID=A0A9Q8Z565_CURCL|nr:uncharacterized protein yc1106_03800 [Curvularia clavata]
MAKPKRMSELFASSSEKDTNTTAVTATPPYSSEGPTLPIIGAPENETEPSKRRKATNGNSSTATKKPSQQVLPSTIHPSLYEPWTRLPPNLFKQLSSQNRLQSTENIAPIVISKNQNVKSGINRLKTYLGAYKDPASTIELPDALKREDAIIAVSAQGEGTTKLVGIIDMVRRIVAPSEKEQDRNPQVETWAIYTMLTSVEVERKGGSTEQAVKSGDVEEAQNAQEDEDEEDEAFEPMDVDGHSLQDTGAEKDAMRKRKVPVLTVWMTRKKIPAFKSMFGEQTFSVQKMPDSLD